MTVVTQLVLTHASEEPGTLLNTVHVTPCGCPNMTTILIRILLMRLRGVK